MISFANFVSVLAVLVLTLLWWVSRRQYKLPPGPVGIPLLGYAPFLSEKSYKDLYKLSKKYGNTFSLYMGRSLFVILSDYKSMKEAFNNPAGIDRPPELFDLLPDSLGFAGNNGEEWVEQRRFSVKAMKDIGMGKSQFDKMLEEEVSDFVKFMETKAGKSFDPFEALSTSVSNNMTSLVFGKRLEMGDPRRAIVNAAVEAASQSFRPGGLANIFPGLLKIFSAIGITDFAKFRKQMVKFNNYLRSEAENRRKILHEVTGDSFIDTFLREMEKYKGVKNSGFHEHNMLGNAQALIIGGSETTRTAILWLMLAMIVHPKVQKKVQEEIDNVIGKEGRCQWQDRAKLPYTYATIMEAQRWRTIAPLNVVHRAGADFKLNGYDIPKGADIIGNIWAVHMDPQNWKDPENFIPERFLLKDNSLMTQRPDNYLPFSVGRRNCPGEFVALIEIFHYFQAIMQKFTVLAPSKNAPVDTEGELGTDLQPARQDFLFVVRD